VLTLYSTCTIIIYRKEEDMRISEIADLLTSIGTLLVGIASIITAIKKEPKKKNRPRRFK
ncbi:TPA: hypothetical protein ACWZQO_000265, partial [Streptococcus agalactiae]